MEILVAGFTVIANGLLTVARAVLSPVAALVLIMAAGLAWMAVIEIEELNRRSSKPTTPLH